MIRTKHRAKPAALSLLAPLALVAGCAVDSGDADVPRDGEGPRAPLQLNLDATEGPIDIGYSADADGRIAERPRAELLGRVERATAADLAELRDARGGLKSALPVTAAVKPDFRTDFLESVAKESADREVRIIVHLEDERFPWFELKNKALDEADRESIAEVRRTQLKGRLDALAAKLERAGGHDLARYWIVPAIGVTVPTRIARDIAGWSELVAAARGDFELNSLQYRPGFEARQGTRAQAFQDEGYDGSAGNHFTSSNKVRVAVFDTAGLVANHPGFKFSSGTSRIRAMKRCGSTSGSCTAFTPTPAAGDHGTMVMGTLGGSIEGGQDSGFTSTSDRRKRSGIASQPALYYYAPASGTAFWDAMLAVAQDVITTGIDVFNNSWNAPFVCDRSSDVGGANAVLRNATDAGVLIVTAAGNDGQAACKVAWPGTSRNGLTVGGLQTGNASSDYDTLALWPSSSRGGMDLNVNGTVRSGAAALIDLAAPAVYTLLYQDKPTSSGSWYASGAFAGTSLAAPTVAGAAAMTIHSLFELGHTDMDARQLMAYMIMMGDGFNSDTGNLEKKGMSKATGAGRLKAHFMDPANLTGPWGFGCHKGTLLEGEEAVFAVGGPAAESSSITTWKAALVWKDPDLANSSDFILKVRNTCPSILVTQDISFDVRKRVKLLQADISGKCLEIHVLANDIPNGTGGREFAVCDYYQSGSASDH